MSQDIQHPNGGIITNYGSDSASPKSYGYQYSFSQMKGPELVSLHPNMPEFVTEWRDGRRFNAIGHVNTDFLSTMHGNYTDPEHVRHFERKLLSGEGFNDPIRISYHPESGTAQVSDGNHRLKASANLGVSHVPAMLLRNTSAIVPIPKEGRKVGIIRHESEEEWPFKDNDGSNFMPHLLHPKWVMHKGLVLPD